MTRPSIFDVIATGEDTAVIELLEQGPEQAEAVNDQGISAVLWALYHRRGNLAERILAVRGEPDLFEAAALGRTDRIVALLDVDADAHTLRSGDGFTPLHLAAFFGAPEAARLLLERGADPDARSANPARLTPLHSAAAGGNLEIVERLLGAGADPNRTQQGGFTPLMSAASAGNATMVDELVRGGADPAIEADDGRTAASLARDKGHTEIAASLGG